MSMDELDLDHDEQQQRYVARQDGRIAGVIDYELRPGTIVFLHTGTDPAYRGRGIAGRLTEYALDDVRRRGLTVVPLCSYTQHFLAEHPDYADLLGTG